MKTKVKVVMLPTNEAEEGCVIDFNKYMEVCQSYSTKDYLQSIRGKANHLHLVSDEKFEIRDWVYSMRGFIGKFGEFENSYADECRKIVATTDKSLKNITGNVGSGDGVRLTPITPSFVKDYVKYKGDMGVVNVHIEDGKILMIEHHVQEDINPHMHHSSQRFNKSDILDFAQWYSGMDRNKVESAYSRYLKKEK